MNSKKVLIGLLLLSLAVVLSGCVEKESVMLGIPDDVCVIHINETYVRSICWNYNISSFLIDVAPLVIDGHDLIDPECDRWVRDQTSFFNSQ